MKVNIDGEITNVDEDLFVEIFQENRPGNFSLSGLYALYQYFNKNEPNMELDVVKIASNFTELDDLEEIKKAYPEVEDVKSIEELKKLTKVIEFNDGIIIQDI